METILITVNVVLAIVLILLVLLQRSEGGALGLGLSQDNFASTRTVGNFLTKSRRPSDVIKSRQGDLKSTGN